MVADYTKWHRDWSPGDRSVFCMQKISAPFREPQGYTSSRDASRKFDLSNDYISRLCRFGKVEGVLIGKVWYVNDESLAAFIAHTVSRRAEYAKSLAEQRKKEYDENLSRVTNQVEAAAQNAQEKIDNGSRAPLSGRKGPMKIEAVVGRSASVAGRFSAALATAFVSIALVGVAYAMPFIATPAISSLASAVQGAQSAFFSQPQLTDTGVFSRALSHLEEFGASVISSLIRSVASTTSSPQIVYIATSTSAVAGGVSGNAAPAVVYLPSPTIQRTTIVQGGVTQEDLTAQMQALKNSVLSQIFSAGPTPGSGGLINMIAASQRVNTISNATISGASISGSSVSGGSGSFTSLDTSGVLSVTGTGTSTITSDLNVGSGVLYVDSINGRVGIGTTTPSQTFTVSGDGNFTGVLTAANLTASGGLTLTGLAKNSVLASDATGAITATSTPYVAAIVATSTSATSTLAGGFAVGGDQLLVQQATGYIGIGTTSPFALLSVNGSGFFGGSMTATDLTATGTVTAVNILATGSTTLQNFTGMNATTTNATTTNFNATDLVASAATSTSLYASVAHFASSVFDSFTATLATIAGLNVTNSTTTNATSTNSYSSTLEAGAALFGGTATSSFASNGALTLSQALAETSGGTGQNSYTLGDMLYGSGTNTLAKLAGNTSTVQKFLSMTGDGTNAGAPSWQVLPVSGTLSYYFYGLQATSSPAYLLMQSAATSSEVINTYSGLTSTTLIQNWITPTGFPALSFIPAGEYEFHIHASQTAGTAGTLYAEFWEVDSTGKDIAKIGTSESSSALPGTETEYRLFFSNPNTYTMASTASRIVAKVYFTYVGGTDTVNLYLGGTADSHITLPSNTVDATNFVPYVGATKNLDLGLFNASSTEFTTSGTTYLATAGGNVGVGTTSPWRSLSVSGSSDLGVNALAGSFTATSTATSTFAGPISSPSGNLIISSFDGGNKLLLNPYGNAVGINTLNPTYQLDVNGTGRFGGTLNLATALSCTGSQALQTDASGNVSCGNLSGVSTIAGAAGWVTNNVGQITLATTTDQVGIGATTTPYAKLSVISGSTGTTTLALVPSPSATAHIFDIYDNFGNLASVFTADGHFGIGTTSPMSQLAISSSLTGPSDVSLTFADTYSGVNGYVGVDNGDSAIDLGSYTASDVRLETHGTERLRVLGTNGYIGIASTSPWGLLSINANGNITPGTPEFVVGSSTVTDFIVSNGGNVGVGTTSPFALLSVNGSGFFGGSVTATNLTATGTVTAVSILATGSTTLQNFTGVNATTTNATTTNAYESNLVAVNATSTNLYASVAHFASSIFDSFTATLATITGLNVTNSTTTNATSTNAYSSTLAAGTASFGGTATSSFASNGALTLAGPLNGPLQANNGLVSATTSVGVLYGGTGLTVAPTYGQLLVGNATGGYALTATSSLGLPTFGTLAATYPLQYDGTGTFSLAFGTTTSNAWAGTQTFTNAPTLSNFTGLVAANGGVTYATATTTLVAGTNLTFSGGTPVVLGSSPITLNVASSGNVATSSAETAGQLPYWTTTSGTPAKLGSIATSSLTLGLGLNYSGTLGSLVGGTSGNFTLATSSLFTGALGQAAYFNGANALTATSSLFFATSGNVGIGTTTPGSLFAIQGIANFTTATSTLYSSGGINLTSGCFAIAGVCITGTGGGGGTTLTGLQVNDATNTGATLPSNLYTSQTAVIGNTIYLFGGYNGSAVTNVIYSAPVSNPTSWTNTGATLPGNLDSSQIAVIGNTIYLFGGSNGSAATNVIYSAPIYSSNPSNLAYNNSWKVDGNGVNSGGVNVGTQGQLPFYNAAGTTLSATSSIFLAQSGYVGIGTTTPNWLLQVAGTRPSLALTDTSAGTNLKHWLFSSMGGNLYIGTSTDAYATSTPSALTILNNGNVGIGTASPTQKLEVSSVGGSYPQVKIDNTSAGGSAGMRLSGNNGSSVWDVASNWSGSNNEFTVLYNSTTSVITALTNGNVGIGTTGPLTKLDVNVPGTTTLANIQQNLSSNGIALNGGAYGAGNYLPGLIWYTGDQVKPKAGVWAQETANGSYLDFGTSNNYGIGITNTALAIDYDGNVGIGTTSPVAPLSVVAVSSATSTITVGRSEVGSESQILMYGGLGGHNYSITNNNFVDGLEFTPSTAIAGTAFTTPTLELLGNGNVGIGTTSPATLLEAGGSTANVTFDGYKNCTGFTSNANGLLACTASDERLKQDITPLDSVATLAGIDALNPVSFYWDPETQRGPREQFGFIAQQVQQVFPNLVATSSPTSLTPDGTLSLDYNGLIAPAVLAIQELHLDLNAIASAAASSTPESQSFASSFFSNLFAKLVQWFADATNGIGKFFAGEVHTKEMCVAKSDGTEACLNGDELAALMAGQTTSSSTTSSTSTSTSTSTTTSTTTSSTSTSTPPVISVNGADPAEITVGDSYVDLGATITGPSSDLNLGISAIVNGGATTTVDQIHIDTSTAGTSTIEYVVVDQNGLMGTATRTVVVNPVTPAPAPTTYSIIASVSGTGIGAISPTGTTTVTSGNTQQYTVTPDASSTISALIVDGASVATSTTYTFSNVTANHTIDAEFTPLP